MFVLDGAEGLFDSAVNDLAGLGGHAGHLIEAICVLSVGRGLRFPTSP